MSGPTTKGMPALISTGDVAAALGWDPDTIRAHLIPFTEWKALDPEERRGKVPCLKLGARYKIPRWWLEETLAAVKHPQTM